MGSCLSVSLRRRTPYLDGHPNVNITILGIDDLCFILINFAVKIAISIVTTPRSRRFWTHKSHPVCTPQVSLFVHTVMLFSIDETGGGKHGPNSSGHWYANMTRSVGGVSFQDKFMTGSSGLGFNWKFGSPREILNFQNGWPSQSRETYPPSANWLSRSPFFTIRSHDVSMGITSFAFPILRFLRSRWQIYVAPSGTTGTKAQNLESIPASKYSAQLWTLPVCQRSPYQWHA